MLGKAGTGRTGAEMFTFDALLLLLLGRLHSWGSKEIKEKSCGEYLSILRGQWYNNLFLLHSTHRYQLKISYKMLPPISLRVRIMDIERRLWSPAVLFFHFGNKCGG